MLSSCREYKEKGSCLSFAGCAGCAKISFKFRVPGFWFLVVYLLLLENRGSGSLPGVVRQPADEDRLAGKREKINRQGRKEFFCHELTQIGIKPEKAKGRKGRKGGVSGQSKSNSPLSFHDFPSLEIEGIGAPVPPSAGLPRFQRDSAHCSPDEKTKKKEEK